MLNPAKKFTLIISVLISLLFLLSIYAWFNIDQNKNLKVIFLDVGQGDSVLIKTPNKQNILIDGGPDSTVLYRLGQYLPFYDKTIDLMILTHPHSDHVAGLVDVLQRYKVKQVLSTGVAHTSPDYLKWLELIKNKKIDFIKVDGYKKIDFTANGDGGNEVILEILYPFEDVSQNSFKDLNESSVVVKLTFGSSSFLFTGDLPIEGEEELIKSGVDLQTDVLKVGHHGSKYSSSLKFLEHAQPKYAVIQVGKDNSFNHPHRRAIRNLEKIDVKILRTDQLSDIIFTSTGDEIKSE